MSDLDNAIVCGHWLIEDRPHRIRDVDRDGSAPMWHRQRPLASTASLRNLAITILRPAGQTSIGVAWRHHARQLGAYV